MDLEGTGWVSPHSSGGSSSGSRLLLCLLSWDREAFSALAAMPRWYYIAGVISVLVVAGSTFPIPRLGAGAILVVYDPRAAA